MKSHREELWFHTDQRRAYINITPQVETAVVQSGIEEGLVLVNAMHITASVYINDDEPGLIKDYDEFLEKLAPEAGRYRHNNTGEDNGDAHIKTPAVWSGGGGSDYQWEAGLWSLGTDFLCGIRWASAKTGFD